MKKLLFFFALLCASYASATVVINETDGWFESGYVTWDLIEEADSYHVYYKPENGSYTKLDNELVRNYGTYGRADVVGITAGEYSFKIVPVNEEGNEMTELSTESSSFTAKEYDRAGFAHLNYKNIGAYNDDGTLKSGARVIYVTSKTAKTVKCTVAGTERVGLQDIIAGYEKGTDNTPIAIRLIGTIEAADMDYFGSSAEGIQMKGKNGYSEMNITLEGIGNDAAIRGFGILLRNCTSVEIRNFGIYLCMDDCLSFDTNNSHCWVHNIDFFYGKTGSSSDQAKGDGSLDCKENSTFMTFSYNRFWDSGKMALCGMKKESTDSYISYHHNWFDHSDSRHPRVRTMSVHVYNNYFDGCSKYGVGATMGGSVFVESNYYRNTNRPMMISLQGSDATGAGTFSGENGGMIKSYGNVFAEKSNNFQFITHKQSATSFDSYDADSRNEVVPSTYKTLAGGTTYNNFDTDPTKMYEYTPHAANEVPEVVTGKYGAGRMQHGDFVWVFNNAVDDASYAVNEPLKAAITNYKSSFIGFFGEETDGNQGGNENGNEGEDNNNDNSNPSIPSDGNYVCTFEKAGANNSFYTINGSVSNSKGTAVVDGTTYEWCLKIETSTSIKFTIDKPMTLTLVFADGSNPNIKINDVKTTSSTGNNIISVKLGAGSHELTKADSNFLFLINLTEDISTGIGNIKADNDEIDGPIYDLFGRIINKPTNGVYIQNGKKFIVR